MILFNVRYFLLLFRVSYCLMFLSFFITLWISVFFTPNPIKFGKV